MITPVVQRWRSRRDSYRPAGEPINTSRYEVVPIERDGPAKAFVLEHHYAKSYPAARFRYGLYRSGELVGVAVFSHPASERVLAVFPGDRLDAVELGRFVLLDDVPANGESWFIARCFELLRRSSVSGVVSFADPVPRTNADGELVFPGHAGTIYAATNGTYSGRSKPEARLLLPDGTMLPGRSLSKIRARDRGHEYMAERLVAHGAAPLRDDEDARAWLARELPAITRRLEHGGNHRYLWGLDRHVRRHLARTVEAQAYPKLDPRTVMGR